MVAVMIAAIASVVSGLVMFFVGDWSGQEKQKAKKKPQPKWGRDDEK